MNITRYLRAHVILLPILLLCGAAAWVEYYQRNTFQHMQPQMHARAQPQLQGEALRQAAQVLFELYPQAAQPNLMMGTALIEQGRLKEARQYLEHTLAVERRNQGALFLYARLLLDLGEDPEKVKDIVDEIRSGFPKSREKIEAYFEQASKGRIRFEEGGVY